MKKILFSIFLFVPIFFLLPNKIRAVSCTSLNPPGRCDTAVTCSQGTPLNGSCGAFQVCCPIITTPCTSLTPPGRCDTAVTCSQGTPLNGSCGAFQVCCPIITATCASLGGRCDVAATCSQGTPLNGSCGALQVCCPIITATCASLGGRCDTAVTCSQGTRLNGSCGALQVCCPIITPDKGTDVLCTPTGGTANSGVLTAIGCISVLGSPELFLSDILRWAVGIGGGVAFLLIIYAGFMIMTSAGNPDRLKAGQELLTSAISGLILLVFSIFILKFIGIDILGLCKFGFGGSCPVP